MFRVADPALRCVSVLKLLGEDSLVDTASGPLIERLRARQARVGVIGLGYVGLPLAVEFAKAGFSAIGFDVDASKIEQITRGESYIPDVPASQVRTELQAGRLCATTDFGRLAEVDTIDICVPTPLRKTRDPDLSFIVDAVEEIAKYLCRGQLVVLESTSYPGTIEEIVQPRLEATGLRAGRDFYLAFSPERVDPGNPSWNTANIPKVVGGLTKRRRPWRWLSMSRLRRRSFRCPRPGWPRWSSYSRTPFGPSTLGSSTSWR